MAEAARFCNISSGNLGQILNTPKAAGKDPQTGRLLHWQDYELAAEVACRKRRDLQRDRLILPAKAHRLSGRNRA